MADDLEKEQEESKPLEMNPEREEKEAEKARENITVEDSKGEKKFVEEKPKEENLKSELKIVPENKEGKIRSFLKGKNKEPSWKPFIFVMILSSIVLFFWDNQNFLVIKEGIHTILDPSAGALLNWNLIFGMTIIVFLISLLTTLAQKYCTDQETIKELKKEQKIIQEKSKEFRDNPEKMMEIQKEIMPLTMKTMKLSMRAVMFTGIPFILFFRWFHDFFTIMGDPKFFGVLSWFWFYFIAVMIFSGVLRKLLKVV